jgi:hypothetical protein
MGIGVGLAAGVACGLLAAPMRGAEMRRSLRSRADGALDRGMTLLEEGRRAFRTRSTGATAPAPHAAPQGSALTASLGEIAQMHTEVPSSSGEARS